MLVLLLSLTFLLAHHGSEVGAGIDGVLKGRLILPGEVEVLDRGVVTFESVLFPLPVSVWAVIAGVEDALWT